MHDNNPYVLALESKSKTKEGKMGKSILSLKRSFRRVTKALSRVNFLLGVKLLELKAQGHQDLLQLNKQCLAQ